MSLDDGWIEWKGGERAIYAYDDVFVKFRNGRKYGPIASFALNWKHNRHYSDIVAYKLAPPRRRG